MDLIFFTEFDSFNLQADNVTVVEYRRQYCERNIVSKLHLAKIDPRGSRTVSLRQLAKLHV